MFTHLVKAMKATVSTSKDRTGPDWFLTLQQTWFPLVTQ